jgi:hypothetical protein
VIQDGLMFLVKRRSPNLAWERRGPCQARVGSGRTPAFDIGHWTFDTTFGIATFLDFVLLQAIFQVVVNPSDVPVDAPDPADPPSWFPVQDGSDPSTASGYRYSPGLR